MKFKIFPTLILSLFLMHSCTEKVPEGEWQTMFDGTTLDGWKTAKENPESFLVEDGAIKCEGERSHLFYDGEFENFEFEAEVKTLPKANSGIYIHTVYQDKNYPETGHEIQINNSHRGP
ncbi:MAG: DUF1080 domain-containing protein, partial [Draconibacterium sp.]|nr:DUF1080 domain-containing protein [Draconibacterium sp.]